jgi:hypothetical protein
MGSSIIVNDTLQITREQGFPVELDIDKHRHQPLRAEEFSDRIFEFKNKPSIRIYHAPPVRVFLAENRNGKWLYWGLVHVLEVVHDQVNQMTSGKFKIVYLYDLEEMKKAHQLMDRKPETDYFAE